ncbi:MAG: nicotinate phosphoribosyltransferase [Aminobacterium sp.]|jgi:nicotinate phosphoribosyltransferase|uniref:nicotinate phosphoribosyltransferase n=1 Tax=unclassified Aminobacterium TaxID=2685012 RepID=UPI001BCEA582|nr:MULTISPECIES: nicotinate phosphoribosyltransferase [unclassified Aminobacterium]MDD2207528.1 nicotinate phosphoribosyltransferase [Aminobacterium sp.]MDD3426369.1 nicotinate phosphoribosyltransferase [Aminobacterium sp.]MDD3707517.1 nicotinate phosphoribosyltransferase [Aminobacterium sp.]MDD4229364.1 nicotinate phosphoribosyltransferase [Aminobacterium sp.]MDD4552356.1 nicotinate phosphoribosyltransferase [Aminobacterium sp.]
MTKNGNLNSLDDLSSITVDTDRFYSATHEEILSGLTSDVYFLKTKDVLHRAGKDNTPVVAEFFARGNGVFAGLPEAMRILQSKNVSVSSLQEGDTFAPKEVVMRISGAYSEFGLYETVLLGILASSSGWATAARQCVEAAEGRPVLCFGARHVHPAIAPVMERVAVAVGGCSGASCMLGAKLAGHEPTGTVPHAAVLIVGDTVELAKYYDQEVPEGEPRIVLIDTFKDEAEESLRVARALGDRLFGVRLDTPGERGGVTPELVKEVRYRLDIAGFSHVKIIASGGLNPERIRILSEAGVDSFGVGSYIAHGTPRDMTMDLKVIDGIPIAKRGRLPGIIENSKLKRVK